jgi:hypothetical protein
MSRIKTGDIVQIRTYGQNYIVLGKAEHNDGSERIVLFKNGMIKNNGQVRKIAKTKRYRLGKTIIIEKKPIIKIVKPYSIKRVHYQRDIDLLSVRRKYPKLSTILQWMDGRSGVKVSAPHIMDVTSRLERLRG